MSSVFFIALGIALVVITISDIFQSVLVPRPAARQLRMSAYLSLYGWQMWRAGARFFRNTAKREDYLGTFAPLLLVSLLVFWVATLIVGYGCIFYGLRDQLKGAPDFLSTLYFAGTSLLTIGYGDITPAGPIARAIALFAGASGFGVVAIVTTYLFSILGAFQKRESFVVAFTNRAGAPPSGLEMIKLHAKYGLKSSYSSEMRAAQMWMADVLETHIAYPVLNYFRSNHDHISWIAVFGALLDASTLLTTTIDLPEARGEAFITNRLGRHFVNDFGDYFDFNSGGDVGIERSEFDRAYDALAAADVPLLPRDDAWDAFSQVRSTYANRLNEIARWWEIPPAQWISDRSLIPHHPPLKVVAAKSFTADGVSRN